MLPARLLAAACAVVGLLHVQTALAEDGRTYEKVSFYFAAHEDDWQLFMNPSAFEDVANSKNKVVFVHVTAGDAGLGTGDGGRKHPYYLARENGAETAIRFMADSGERPLERVVRRMSFAGHRVERVIYRNTVSYFLRIPDGHPSGSGFAETGNQSLERLANGQIKTLTAVDGSAVYRGWADLVSTVRAIVNYERGHARSIQLNVAEQDTALNPNDHSDHRMTAKVALEAAQDIACARRVFYVDYASSKLPENLSAEQREMESSVLAVTAAGILAFDHTSIWARYHRTYLGRNYFRVEEAAGRCEDAVVQSANAAATGALSRKGQSRAR
jgi:hypothetical protein